MVNVDTVYQKVLALANKEQRGYITPQEFNLLADKAQMEIFHNYFHNTKTSYHKPKNQMGVSFDEIEMIQEKLHPFKRELQILQYATNPILSIGTNYHLINTITNGKPGIEVTELTEKEIAYSESNPLTKATLSRPVYVREPVYGTFKLYPTPTEDTTYVIDCWVKPRSPNWAYVVVNEKALYNSNLSDNFMLHASEEETLVVRILQLAGTIIEKSEVTEVALVDQANIKREQND